MRVVRRTNGPPNPGPSLRRGQPQKRRCAVTAELDPGVSFPCILKKARDVFILADCCRQEIPTRVLSSILSAAVAAVISAPAVAEPVPEPVRLAPPTPQSAKVVRSGYKI